MLSMAWERLMMRRRGEGVQAGHRGGTIRDERERERIERERERKE